MPGSPAAEVGFHPARIDAPEVEALLAAYQRELVDSGVVLDHGSAGGVDHRDFEPPYGRYLVGRLGGPDGPVVACGGVRLRGEPPYAEIKRMYVVPDARGSGLARRLLATLEQAGRELGAEVARMDTGRDMVPAVRLYRSSGYREIDDYNGNPDAGWWFEKRLV